MHGKDQVIIAIQGCPRENVVKVLQKGFWHSSGIVAAWAIEVSNYVYDVQFCEEYKKLLSSNESMVRQEAAGALIFHATPNDIPWIKNILQNEQNNIVKRYFSAALERMDKK